MALPTADAPARWSPGVAWARVLSTVEAYPLERIGLAALAAGILLRLAAPFLMDFRSDGDTYVAMGHAWMLRHEFLMPYGDVTTWGPTDPGYSNHYPPAYPFFLGIVFTLFGYGLWQAKWAAVVVAIAALVVVYVTTRDLYGRTAAALAGGLLGLEPHLLWVTGSGFSENMVLGFFALTMWAILRSLKDDRYIVLAGLFAALAYLSRASVGYFFVVAGGGGFLWRFYYRRWKLFTNYWYMLAILVFLAVAVTWAIRNVLHFGYATEPLTILGKDLYMPLWETSSYTRYVQNRAFQEPELWRTALLAKIPLFLAFLAWYAIPFLPETWKATKRIREEQTSALWLSVFLVFVIAWAISSMFWVFEKSSLYWLDNHRYVVIGLLPLSWLVLREARPERASFRARYVILLVSLFIACAATIYSPVKFSDLRAAEHMDTYLLPGDEVAVDGGTIKYAFYAYLSHPDQIRVYGWGTDAAELHPEFIVSLKGTWDWGTRLNKCDAYEGYDLVGAFHQHFWTSGVMTACLHATPEVIDARGIQTGIVVID